MSSAFNEILNQAIDTAVCAVMDMERTQVNGLLEKLESEEEEKGVAILILHIMRQNARNVIANRTANKLIKYLKKILESDPEHAKEKAREFLGLLKWLYDPSQKLEIKPEDLAKPDFMSYLQVFVNKTK